MRLTMLAVLAAAVALLSVAPIDAAEPKPLITKVYPVADLVIPIPDFVLPDQPIPVKSRQEKRAVASKASDLIKLVHVMVQPNSWNVQGGAGAIQFSESNLTLSVTNTDEVIQQVGRILEALRRLQDLSVATEVRIVTAPVGLCERLGMKQAGGTLTDREMARLLEAVENDRTANVVQFPKVTTFDGQTATIRCGDRRLFVTGGEVTKVKGQTVFVPKQTPVDLGDTLQVCGTASDDRRSVHLKVKVARTTLVGEVELVPVTVTIKPEFADGSRSQSIPFTQYLQAPEFETQSAEKTVDVPDGGTVLIGKWRFTQKPAAPPMIARIPYLSRLYEKDNEPALFDVVVLATARIIQSEPAGPPIAPVMREAHK